MSSVFQFSAMQNASALAMFVIQLLYHISVVPQECAHAPLVWGGITCRLPDVTESCPTCSCRAKSCVSRVCRADSDMRYLSSITCRISKSRIKHISTLCEYRILWTYPRYAHTNQEQGNLFFPNGFVPWNVHCDFAEEGFWLGLAYSALDRFLGQILIVTKVQELRSSTWYI